MNDNKAIRAEWLEIIDKWVGLVPYSGPNTEFPHIIRYDGKGRILSWLTFLVDGTPDVRVFGQTEPRQPSRSGRLTERRTEREVGCGQR